MAGAVPLAGCSTGMTRPPDCQTFEAASDRLACFDAQAFGKSVAADALVGAVFGATAAVLLSRNPRAITRGLELGAAAGLVVGTLQYQEEMAASARAQGRNFRDFVSALDQATAEKVAMYDAQVQASQTLQQKYDLRTRELEEQKQLTAQSAQRAILAERKLVNIKRQNPGADEYQQVIQYWISYVAGMNTALQNERLVEDKLMAEVTRLNTQLHGSQPGPSPSVRGGSVS